MLSNSSLKPQKLFWSAYAAKHNTTGEGKREVKNERLETGGLEAGKRD
jgi:hypothetical protein